MAPGAKAKGGLISRHRRRAAGDSDEEEEAASVGSGESHSDASADNSGVEEDGDGEQSVVSAKEMNGKREGADVQQHAGTQRAPVTVAADGSRAARDGNAPVATREPLVVSSAGAFATSADTKIMTGAEGVGDAAAKAEVVDFEDAEAQRQGQGKAETLAERRRREHEEYRQRREADPTFIPSRGAFFMHDARAGDQRGFMGGRGRGRGGRPFVGGPYAPMMQRRPAEAQWTHDLHEAIEQPPIRVPAAVQHHLQRQSASQPEYRPYSFSTSKVLGKVQVRVYLPQMHEAKPVPGVIIKQHTQLPDHRPPLRRDKPVRVALADRTARYVFPSQERSFIFIPRALRPNQQSFSRARGPPSRRTSAYGGSVYASSVAPSRRSSIARDIGRENMFSPTGSVAAQRHFTSARPVVRLPQGLSQPSSIASPVGSIHAYGGAQGFPPPQTPAIEHYREAGNMHQPRPQKAISVSGIDSPAALSLHAPHPASQQRFENQIPHSHHQHAADGSFGSSYHGEAYPMLHQGTPLSNIPERAIHARPFQPPAGQQAYAQPFYAQYAQPGWFYPPAQMMSAPQDMAGAAGAGADNMMAHESGGTVYYIDPTVAAGYTPQAGYGGGPHEGYGAAPGYDAGGQEAGWYYPAPAAGIGTVYYQQA